MSQKSCQCSFKCVATIWSINFFSIDSPTLLFGHTLHCYHPRSGNLKHMHASSLLPSLIMQELVIKCQSSWDNSKNDSTIHCHLVMKTPCHLVMKMQCNPVMTMCCCPVRIMCGHLDKAMRTLTRQSQHQSNRDTTLLEWNNSKNDLWSNCDAILWCQCVVLLVWYAVIFRGQWELRHESYNIKAAKKQCLKRNTGRMTEQFTVISSWKFIATPCHDNVLPYSRNYVLSPSQDNERSTWQCHVMKMCYPVGIMCCHLDRTIWAPTWQLQCQSSWETSA